METLILLSSVARVFPEGSSGFLQVIIFLGMWLGFWLPLAIPLILQSKWRPFQPLEWAQKLPLLTSLYLLAPIVVWTISPAGLASFSSYGWLWKRTTLQSAILGFGVAVSGLAILFAIERSCGWIEWQLSSDLLKKIDDLHLESTFSFISLSKTFAAALFPILGLAVWIGGTEELIFRGVLLDLLRQDYSLWSSAAIASLIFALLHLIWELKQTLPQLPGLWLMGMVLTLARIGDGGSLGFAVGLHAGWIWGISSFETVLSPRYTGKVSPWITGIAAKPLAGILGVLLLLATGAILVFVNG